jgi:hypothetical protein
MSIKLPMLEAMAKVNRKPPPELDQIAVKNDSRTPAIDELIAKRKAQGLSSVEQDHLADLIHKRHEAICAASDLKD